jgi:hypothetical protein
MNILGIFKKADGEYEVNRTVGAIGGLVYIFAGPALVLANIIKNVSFTQAAWASWSARLPARSRSRIATSPRLR